MPISYFQIPNRLCQFIKFIFTKFIQQTGNSQKTTNYTNLLPQINKFSKSVCVILSHTLNK